MTDHTSQLQLEAKKQLSQKMELTSKLQLESKKQLSQKATLLSKAAEGQSLPVSPNIIISSPVSLQEAVSKLNSLGDHVSASVLITGDTELLSSAVSRLVSISKDGHVSALISIRGDK